MKNTLSFLRMLLLVACFMVEIHAQINSTGLVIQGTLRDQQNKAVADGNYSLRFALYTAATGGTAVWQETQSGVAVQNGVFTAKLGSVTAIPTSVNFTQQYWVGITVTGQGAELAPRIELTAAPYALALRGSENVFGGSGNVGIGTLNPSQKLDVSGNIRATGNIQAGTYLSVQDSVTLRNRMRFSEYGAGIFDVYAKPLVQQSWLAGNGDRLILRPGGSTTAANLLEVNSNRGIETGLNTPLIINTSTWGFGLRLATTLTGALNSDDYFISRGGTDATKNDFVLHFDNEPGAKLNFVTPGSVSRMVIEGSTGNVGIGTTTPNAKLDVHGTVELFGTRAITKGTLTTGYQVLYSGTPATDVIVNAIAQKTNASNHTVELRAYIPGETIAFNRWNLGEGDAQSISFPAKKGENISVTLLTSTGAAVAWTVIITPLGQ
ncbi:MAG: hypothetical protein HRU80_00830 [Ignavibacteriales bacterium]|nr:MAG: hypothetical protein HRU80_00830 [Ignavibacteriales bacterium]